MKEGFVASCLFGYIALQLYAGYAADYRDTEDLCNQMSHVMICIAISAATWQYVSLRYIAVTLVVLNIAELVDEFRIGNYKGLHWHDYVFPFITVLIALMAWKYSKKK